MGIVNGQEVNVSLKDVKRLLKKQAVMLIQSANERSGSASHPTLSILDQPASTDSVTKSI